MTDTRVLDAALPSWRCNCCGCPMVGHGRFQEDPDGWRARGVRRHGAGGRCNSCYHRARRGQEGPARPKHDRDHVIAEWRRMVAKGASHAVIADHLGITRATLNGILKRGRRDGLIEDTQRARRAAGRSEKLSPDELARLRRAVGLPTGGVS